MTTRATGVAIAFATAIISGVSIWVNGRAVRHFGDATVYTTAKNLVAGILLIAILFAGRGARSRREATALDRRQWLSLLAVGVVGGSIPFVLFFEGLARAEATQASFIQKTLVVWVVLLAVPLLHERFGWPHAAAIALLIAGQAWLVGSAGTIAVGEGEAMILAATLLWAIEIVFVKHLLGGLSPSLLAAARMGFGSALLLSWVAVSGRWSGLTSLDSEQWRWVLLTGLLLTAYVGTWYAALARAQAIDVTAVLVFGAFVTAALSGAIDGKTVSALGMVMVAAGSVVIAIAALRSPVPEPEPAGP
ncbi:MAG TPA: DMT family transporter [Gaiellaceae bacterium]|nr:DMT family transporter [Gaiellaceae bacterium]